jgi:phosphatidylserine decarboxylase
MSSEPVVYFDRYSGTLKTEKIFGEKWLRRIYGNPLGRAAASLLIKRAFISRYYGWKMKKPVSALQILPFIVEYDIDVEDFTKSAFDFKTFNEFFYRGIKPEKRPIAPGDNVAVLPADGRHLVFQNIDTADGFYVKGAKFDISELIGVFKTHSDLPLIELFKGASMVISRLCPVDYHRFHFPVSGVPHESELAPGWLYSVSPLALRHNIRYLVLNKRVLTLIDSPVFGKVAMIEVGATNVGTVQQGFVPGKEVQKGEEKGFFSFGGSCVITLFQKGRISFDKDLLEQSALYRETFAKVGDRLGEAF